jgi:hypothetical protein
MRGSRVLVINGLIAISLEEVAEVQPIALGSVISHEARSRGEVEQAIVALGDAMELADFCVRYILKYRFRDGRDILLGTLTWCGW